MVSELDTIKTPSGSLFYEYIDIPDGPGLKQLAAILEILPPLNLRTGPWLAGGAPRRLLQSKSLEDGDVDIFFSETKDWKQFDKILGHYEEVFKSPRATTYLVNGLKVQIIKRRFYDSLDAIFKDFDFSVCQIATDGKKLGLTKQAHLDIMDNVLRFAPQGVVAKYTVVKRMAKYLKHGFLPEPGLYKTIVESGLEATSAWAIFEGAEDLSIYDHEEQVDQLVTAKEVNSDMLRTIARKMGLEILGE